MTSVYVRDPDPVLADHLLVDEVAFDGMWLRLRSARSLDRATAGCDEDDRKDCRSR
jgi:hypothetical protein